jgi:peptidyl-prolyl cis-trans isomerase B (cyclophilin B)
MIKQFFFPAVGLSALALFVAACGGGNGEGTGDGGGAFAKACQKTNEKQFSAAPEQIIDTNKTYIATVKTEKGDIVLELFSDVPITANNFVFLACKGFYDGLTFHRVIPDFVAQGGDPEGTGTGGPGYSIPDEDDGDHLMEAGVISMAKSGPDTTGSQFFITYAPQPHLDDGFTVFGRVTEGMDVLEQIVIGDIIETITIEEQ